MIGIIIDAEHGALGDESVHNSVAAISALGVSPIIRVRGPAHDILKRALDTGAHGIMVPQINNAEEARAVAAEARAAAIEAGAAAAEAGADAA